ncbi:MAG: bifunctional DNA primase/polymerase [Bacillota bacterium]
MPEPQRAIATLQNRQIEKHKQACLIAARDYIERGWALVPITPGGKTPYTPLLPEDSTGKRSWIPFKLRRATMPEVEAWYDLEPRLNLGIICGQASGGLIVVDYDLTPSDLVETVFVRTSRRNHFHAYYHSSQPEQSRNFEYGQILAEGKIAVAPPSFNAETRRYYSFYEGYSLEDRGIENYSYWLQTQGLQRGKNEDGKGIYISTCIPPLLAGKTDISTCIPSLPQNYLNEDRLREYARVPEVAIAILERCGVRGVRLGKSFRCPLPGHGERRPSAALYQTDSGEIIFHDFHNREQLDKPTFTLAEVYRAIHTRACSCVECRKYQKISGGRFKLTAGEQALWLVKALVETGFLRPLPILAPRLPEGTPDTVRDVYKGFLEVLELHRIYNPDNLGAPYSNRFAHRWTGRGARQCQQAIQWLVANGYMRIVKKRGEDGCKSSQWTVGNPDVQEVLK